MTDLAENNISNETGSPFHKGERQIHQRLGLFEVEEQGRNFIRSYMPDQHRDFFSNQPFLIVSARDSKGRPWATVLEGKDGFVTSPDPTELLIDSQPVKGDALHSAFAPGAEIGILGIELETRRRNRVNGHINGVEADVLRFNVGQSFGNCPQYIRERAYWRTSEPATPVSHRRRTLSEDQKTWIKRADTFFIASGYRGDGEEPSFGMDVSHRGGEAGFVEVRSEREIRFPDYAGNNAYNTLGNLTMDPRAGFLFLDFSTGSLLQITGRASIDWTSEDIDKFPGAKQLISLEIDEVVEVRSALRLRWQEDADSVRSLKLIDKIKESEDVTSFVFRARDNGPLNSFKAGQHLPIEVTIPGGPSKIQRTYSLSGDPKNEHYRLSVKREANGLVSRYLHDQLAVGAMIHARKPAGGFQLAKGEGPLVLISAGVGITPMISLLHEHASRNETQPIWFVHGARDGAHHPFRKEVIEMAAANRTINTFIAYSRPKEEDRQAGAFDLEGRLTAAHVLKFVGTSDARYLICGPATFSAQMVAGLEKYGVPENRIEVEAF